MSKKFLVNIDMGGNQIINPIINGGTLYGTTLGNGANAGSGANLVTVQNFTTANLPVSSLSGGMIAYDTTTGTLKVYVAGSTNAWTSVGAGVQSIAGTTNQISASSSTGAITLSFPTAGVTLPGKTTLTASTTSNAALNIPTGSAPTSPSQGDIWNASDVLYYRNASATKTVAYTDSTLTGTWNGSVIGPAYGGTGVANNAANTITFTGNFSLGLTLSANTSVTLPTSGTLLTTTGSGSSLTFGTGSLSLAANLTTSGANAITLAGAAGGSSVTLPSTGTLVNSAVTTLSSLASVGTITTGVWNGTAITTAYGGTGLTSYTAGDLLYYSTGTTLSKLAAGTSNYVLTSSGTAPQYVAQSTLSVGSATNATNTAITDDTTTNATVYPTWVTANTGNLPQKVASTKLTFNPSTGNLASTTFNALTLTAAATGFTIAGGTTSKTLTLSETMTLTAGAAGQTFTMPSATDTIVGRASTDTLTNKTLTNPTINGANMTGTITVPTPVNGTDAANKNYVDNVASGVNAHDAVQYATTTTIAGTYTAGTTGADGGTGVGATITYTSTGTTSIDSGSNLALNDRVLVKNGVTADSGTASKANGIYYVTTAGSVGVATVLTRALDSDNSIAGDIMAGDLVYVIGGTTNGGTQWIQTATGTATTPNKGIKIGTDSITFTQFSGASSTTAGNGLVASGNAFNVQSTSGSISVTSDSIDLPTSGMATSGSYGASNDIQYPVIGLDSYGRVTSASTTTIRNAAADGSTKGVAAFNATHFSASSGVVSLNASATASTQTDANVGTSALTYAVGKQTARITGTGLASSFVVKHPFGNTTLVAVQVIEVSSGNEVEVDITRGNGQVTITFATAPLNTVTYDVVIIG